VNVVLIDIGNSRVKWRFAAVSSSGIDPVEWLGAEASVALVDSAALVANWQPMAATRIEAVFVSNVAGPEREADIVDSAARLWPDAATHSARSEVSRCGVTNSYRDPTQLGTDRWLAMIGAHRLLPGRALLVCGFGTATTIDLMVPSAGDAGLSVFVGGLILPGVETMRTSLSSGTARLPLAVGHPADFGVHTDDAITGGIVAAQAGAVERAIRKAAERSDVIASEQGLTCVVTGGWAPLVTESLTLDDVRFVSVPGLVLHGLAAVACDATKPADQPA
jgi:type III pantothenate kinase